MKFGVLKIESYKKGILFSSAFNFISKLSLFLQSVAIAYYFGTQAKTDVFFYCYATITLVALFINSLDSSVLIPESMRLSVQESKEESVKFLNFFIYVYFFIGIVISLVLYFNPVGIFLMLSSFNKSILQENFNILLFSIPLFTFIIVTNLFANILSSYKFFTIPIMAAMINNLGSLFFVIFFHNILGITSLFAGLTFAYLLNVCFLIYLMKTQLGWNFSFKIIKIRKTIFKNILYSQAGNITSMLVAYIPMYLLSGFNAGVIATLNYGQKTADMPGQLISYQFSSVLGVKFNELYARKDVDNLNRIFFTSTQLLLFVLVPISLMMFLYSNSIISILFKRGAFNTISVEYSGQFLKYFALLLPMLAINVVVSRLFMAGQKIKEGVIYQIVFNCILFAFIYVAIKNEGIIGYPMALICLHIVNVFIVYFILRAFFSEIKYYNIIVSFLKIVGLNILISIPVIYLKHLLNDTNEIVNLIVGGTVYVLILLVFNWYLKLSTEVNESIIKVYNYLNYMRDKYLKSLKKK